MSASVLPDPPASLVAPWSPAGAAQHATWLHGVTGYGVAAVVPVLLLAGWWIARRSGRDGAMGDAVWAVIGALVALGADEVVLPHVVAGGTRMPADHEVLTCAVAVGLFLVDGRLGAVAALVTAVVTFADIYAHAADADLAAAGLLLGATISITGHALQEPALARLVSRLRETPVRPLLTRAPRDPAVRR